MPVVCPSHAMTPQKRRCGLPCRLRARSTLAAPGTVPARCSPISTSITTGITVPAACAAAVNKAMWAGESMQAITRAPRFIAANFCRAEGATTWLAINTSRRPASTMVCASQVVAQVTPLAPAAIKRLAISGERKALVCGRHCLPPCTTMVSAMCFTLRSNASRSSAKNGASGQLRPGFTGLVVELAIAAVPGSMSGWGGVGVPWRSSCRQTAAWSGVAAR